MHVHCAIADGEQCRCFPQVQRSTHRRHLLAHDRLVVRRSVLRADRIGPGLRRLYGLDVLTQKVALLFAQLRLIGVELLQRVGAYPVKGALSIRTFRDTGT